MDQQVMGPKLVIKYCSSISHREGGSSSQDIHTQDSSGRSRNGSATAAAQRALMVVSCPQACAHKAPKTTPKGT